ncbi:MAG: DUF4926 domain-containing protein [Pirellulales bacterium]
MEVGRHVPFCDTQTAQGDLVALPKAYDRVALSRDLTEFGLKRGDVATVVDTVPHPNGGPVGLVLEVSNALGDSLKTVVVTPDDVEPLNANEVLAVRPLSQAG